MRSMIVATLVAISSVGVKLLRSFVPISRKTLAGLPLVTVSSRASTSVVVSPPTPRFLAGSPGKNSSHAPPCAPGAGALHSRRRHRPATAALVSTSDVLCTTTSVAIGEGPVFEDRDLRAWVHVNAVGSDFSGKFELPRSLLERSLVVPDCREQAQREGECQQLPPDRIDTDLVALIQQRERFVGSRDKSSVFDSTGWAYEDHVVMQLFLDHAREMGVGTAIEIESHTDDPHDPYDFIVSGAKSEVGSRESEVRS